MNREEAIQYAEKKIDSASYRLEMGYLNNGLRQIVSNEYEFFMQALSTLRQQEHFREVTKKVEPLTLDELRQMDGEPVWWWNKSAKPVCTICVWDRFMNEPMFANYDWQSEDTLKLSKYKWLKKCGYNPYRQKPEEGTV